MTTRSDFLARVRAGLGSRPGAARSIPEPPAADEQLVRLTAPGEHLAGVFAARAAAVGMSVHHCSAADAPGRVHSLLESLGATTVVLDHLGPAFAHAVADGLAARSVRVLDPVAVRNLDPQFDADSGVTGVLAAIAETGTLVLVSDPRRSRGAFIIPPVHVAIVYESQLIPDMIDLWPLIGNPPPTAITLVTGPSKTADIEGVLVTGVHGPGAVHIVLVAGGHEVAIE